MAGQPNCHPGPFSAARPVADPGSGHGGAGRSCADGEGGLRFDPLSGEWVMFATRRPGRPSCRQRICARCAGRPPRFPRWARTSWCSKTVPGAARRDDWDWSGTARCAARGRGARSRILTHGGHAAAGRTCRLGPVRSDLLHLRPRRLLRGPARPPDPHRAGGVDGPHGSARRAARRERSERPVALPLACETDTPGIRRRPRHRGPADRHQGMDVTTADKPRPLAAMARAHIVRKARDASMSS